MYIKDTMNTKEQIKQLVEIYADGACKGNPVLAAGALGCFMTAKKKPCTAASK